LATDVKENLDLDTAIISGDKATNKILALRDPRNPSLTYLKWSSGPSPTEFEQRFMTLDDAIKFGVQYIESLKTTQAMKNKKNSTRRAKKRERIEQDTETNNTVRKGSGN